MRDDRAHERDEGRGSGELGNRLQTDRHRHSKNKTNVTIISVVNSLYIHVYQRKGGREIEKESVDTL